MATTRRLLSNKKVLLILDHVNHLNHLEILAGSSNWFGPGSRIIVTTRDRHLLDVHFIQVYEMQTLNYDDSLRLFS